MRHQPSSATSNRPAPTIRATITSTLCLLALAALVAAKPVPAQAASSRVDRLCAKAYPHQFSKTSAIRFGTKTVYNRDLSRALVCNGGFGAPDGYRATFAAACDFAMAAYKVVNPAETIFKTWGCAAPAIAEKGWARGSLDAGVGVACGYIADALGVGVGLFAAGATLDPAIGVATWKGVAFVGDTIVCIGVGKVLKDARSWGIKLESDHEMHVARDIELRGKCLRMTSRRLVGIQWSAVDCPPGYGGSRLPVAPTAAPNGDNATGAPTSDGAAVGEQRQGAGLIPSGSIAETAGGVTNTWTEPASAGGLHGASIAPGQTVGIACKLNGFRVANGNTWWYRIASSPWSGSYYASADAFYNNGQTSGSLIGTPWVDPAVPDCAASAVPPLGTAETTGGVAHTWSNPQNAGGAEGPTIGSNQTVGIACKLQGFRVADGNTWWYRIAQAPWNGTFYVSADAFYNNGQTSGSLHGTPFVDPAVPDC